MSIGWAFVIAFIVIGLGLVALIILDPMGNEPDDRTRPGYPGDYRHERHR